MTLRLWSLLRRRLFEEKATAVYDTLDRPLVPILARMEANGIKIDVAKLHELSYHFSRQADVLATSIYEQTGQHFNLASPKQMGDVLFGAMGLPHGKKTKTGAWATDAKTLEDLAAQGHKVVDDILSWRQLTKLISTYTEALPQAINPRTGRVHTSFTLTVTNTGRLSSTDPNLQNIPIRSDDGRQIRTAFVAEAGHRLICLDYSQIELRLVAEMAGIERLKQAFRDGLDIHAATAAEVFGLPLDQVTADKRRAAKAINFGIIYGISGYGLGRQLGVEPAVANAYIKEYMARFPELATFMERTKEFARQHGYVETLWGRKCWIPNIRASGPLRAFAERQAINAPLQGTAADIVKRAMIVVDRYLLDNPQMGGRLLLQVHDELVVEAPETEAAELGATLGRLMEGVCDLSIPLVVGVGTGPNWDQAH
jgi:DNA polymerase-1